MAESEEIVIKAALLDIEDIVLNKHEIIDSLGELGKDGHDVSSHGLSLGVTDLNLLELTELVDSTSKVHNVLAALSKSIEADEKSIG